MHHSTLESLLHFYHLQEELYVLAERETVFAGVTVHQRGPPVVSTVPDLLSQVIHMVIHLASGDGVALTMDLGDYLQVQLLTDLEEVLPVTSVGGEEGGGYLESAVALGLDGLESGGPEGEVVGVEGFYSPEGLAQMHLHYSIGF